MPRKKRTPYTPPPQGDIGPETQAQMNGAVFLTIEEGGTKRRRKRRDTILDIMGKGTRHRAPLINRRQVAAGNALISLIEATQRSPGCSWTRVYVDSSPKPGDVDTLQLEAQDRLAKVRGCIPRGCLPVVNAVCERGLHLLEFSPDAERRVVWLKLLRLGLDTVAQKLAL